MFRVDFKAVVERDSEAFNLHFQEIFFVSEMDVETLLATFDISFNLHFQEIFFVSKHREKVDYLIMFTFQSPFSGDFLCFYRLKVWYNGLKLDFQSPFSGDFLCFEIVRNKSTVQEKDLSISIFRRFSLFRKTEEQTKNTLNKAFNLHFQEIFFVSLVIHATTHDDDAHPFNLHFQEIFFVSKAW